MFETGALLGQMFVSHQLIKEMSPIACSGLVPDDKNKTQEVFGTDREVQLVSNGLHHYKQGDGQKKILQCKRKVLLFKDLYVRE